MKPYSEADCVNFSPPDSRNFGGSGGNWAKSWNFGKFREIEGSSMGFCMALHTISVGIPEGFGGSTWFSGIILK